MRVLTKVLWVAGIFLAFALFLTFMIANAAVQPRGTWTPAFFALPLAVLLVGVLWKTFDPVLPAGRAAPVTTAAPTRH